MRFRDFVCKRNGTYDYSASGIGWTLIDSSYAVSESSLTDNDWFVMQSPGENGLRSMYVLVQYVAAGYFNVQRYLYWDATTHTGTQMFGTSSSWTNQEATNNILSIYGDLDAVIGIAKYSNNYNATLFGWCPESTFDQSFIVAPGAITAGSSRVVTFSSAPPSSWIVGKKLFVEDTANIELVQITAVSGNDVTFQSFEASYAAGAKFSEEKTDYVTGSNAWSTWYMLINHGGEKNGYVYPNDNTITNPSASDGLTGLYPSRKIYCSYTNTFFGPIKNILSTYYGLTDESTHLVGSTGYRFFNLYSGLYCLIKEV